MLKAPQHGKTPPRDLKTYKTLLEQFKCGDVSFVLREAYLLTFTGYMAKSKKQRRPVQILETLVRGFKGPAASLGAQFFAGIDQFTEAEARDLYDLSMDWAKQR